MLKENHFAFNTLTAFLSASDLLSEFNPNNINIVPLKGGRSNATLYKFDVGLSSYVLRFPPSTLNDINKSLHVFLAKQAGILGVGPKIHFIDSEQQAIIMEYIPGQVASPIDFQKSAPLINFSKLLRKLHRSQLNFPLALCPFTRFREFLLKCEKSKINLPLNFSEIKLVMNEIETVLQSHPVTLTPTHLDLNLSNIIILNKEFFLVDWVNGGMSDPYYDLATFSVFAGLNENQTQKFLTYYFQRNPTALEWARFIIMKPIRLFVIAISCFSASSKGEINNLESPLFDEFINKNEVALNCSLWQIGLTVFQKGLRLIQDDSFTKSICYLKQMAQP